MYYTTCLPFKGDEMLTDQNPTPANCLIYSQLV